MTDFKGRFVWYELITTDTAGAKAFYSSVVGWMAEDVPMPGMTYTLMKAKDRQVAGVMLIPAEAKAMGAPPSWTGYVAVDDVDASADQVKRLGGAVHHGPMDIPGVGRFAIAADPQGAVIALFKPLPSDAAEGPADRGTPGHVGWHELFTSDLEAGFAFYREMFGWRKDEAIPMGDMGAYQLFANGDQVLGGMMRRPPQAPVSAWNYYFQVGDIDAAASRVKAAGGQVLNGPMEVPGGDWVLQGQDPQGAMFALVGRKG
ncbi:MAG: VOC family protein [Caulobacteraceae bacterium]|nr:VOC family protein [Caulobacteraceae bacterium]